MPGKRFNEDANISETGNWNVASDYSKLKIMKQLYLADEYETIATFGTSSFMDELELNFNPDFLRIRAFRRLVKSLIMLINNSKFAIKKKTDVKILDDFNVELKRIYKVIPSLFKISRNQIKKTSALTIKRESFDPILNRVIEIKSEINNPLNASDLLFLDKEEFDPRDHKKKIIESITSRG